MKKVMLGVCGMVALTGCTAAELEAFNVALSCYNAYPNDSYSQDMCAADYAATGYLPEPVSYPNSTYGTYGSGGTYGGGYDPYGGYPNDPYYPPVSSSSGGERTVTGFGSSSYSRASALQSAYTNATQMCNIHAGSLGSTEFQDCDRRGESWSCTVRVWCG